MPHARTAKSPARRRRRATLRLTRSGPANAMRAPRPRGDERPYPERTALVRISGMKRLALTPIVALVLGCGSPSATQDAAEPLRIAAASDLQVVMPTLLARFKAETGVEAVATFG